MFNFSKIVLEWLCFYFILNDTTSSAAVCNFWITISCNLTRGGSKNVNHISEKKIFPQIMEKTFSFRETNLTRIMETSFYNRKSHCCSSICSLIENENTRQFVVLDGPYFLLNKACHWDTPKTKKNRLLKQILGQQKELPVKEICVLIFY